MSEISVSNPTLADIKSISWPAVVRHGNQQELSYIANAHDWYLEASQSFYGVDDTVLIDSNGTLFHLVYERSNHSIVLINADQTISLADFETWVKDHLAVMNQCCISKIGLRSFQHGIELVASIQD